MGLNNMHQGEIYQGSLKWGEVYLGHSFIMIKWFQVFFPQNLSYTRVGLVLTWLTHLGHFLSCVNSCPVVSDY